MATKKSTTPANGKQDVKTYTWPVVKIPSGESRQVEAYQTILTLEQESKVAAALKSLQLESIGDLAELTIAQIIVAFAESEIVADFFDAILYRHKGCNKSDLMAMQYEQQKAVMADFFTFNKSLVSDLKNSAMIKAIGLLAAGAEAPPPPSKSSTSAPETD